MAKASKNAASSSSSLCLNTSSSLGSGHHPGPQSPVHKHKPARTPPPPPPSKRQPSPSSNPFGLFPTPPGLPLHLLPPLPPSSLPFLPTTSQTPPLFSHPHLDPSKDCLTYHVNRARRSRPVAFGTIESYSLFTSVYFQFDNSQIYTRLTLLLVYAVEY